MKRSSTSLVSHEEKKIIGLIFGRETKHDLYRNAEVIVKAFEKAKEINGSVHFLKQCEDIMIQKKLNIYLKPKMSLFANIFLNQKNLVIVYVLHEKLVLILFYLKAMLPTFLRWIMILHAL